MVAVGSLCIAIAALRSIQRVALQARQSAPAMLASEQKVVRTHVEALTRDLADFKVEIQGTLDGHRTKLIAWREDIEALLDAVEDTLDRTERKRRSAAASASKIKANGETEDLTDIQSLRARARAMGLDVL